MFFLIYPENRLWHFMQTVSQICMKCQSLFFWRKKKFFKLSAVIFIQSILSVNYLYPASILYKSVAGRYRPVRVADGPITARYRFIKNAYWVITCKIGLSLFWKNKTKKKKKKKADTSQSLTPRQPLRSIFVSFLREREKRDRRAWKNNQSTDSTGGSIVS